MIFNNYKRLQPHGGGGGGSSSDYIESSGTMVVVPEIHNGAAGGCGGNGRVVDDVNDQTAATATTPGGPGGYGAPLMMVQAAVIIGPKDSNIDYGTKELYLILSLLVMCGHTVSGVFY